MYSVEEPLVPTFLYTIIMYLLFSKDSDSLALANLAGADSYALTTGTADPSLFLYINWTGQNRYGFVSEMNRINLLSGTEKKVQTLEIKVKTSEIF